MQGLIGIVAEENDCLGMLKTAMLKLQKRGPAYAGVTCYNDLDRVRIRTHRGVFSETFADDLSDYDGYLALGVTSSTERQPVFRQTILGNYVVGADLRLSNAEQLRDELLHQGYHFTSSIPSEIEIVAALIGGAISFDDGIEKTLRHIAGPAAMVVMTERCIYAAKSVDDEVNLHIGRNDEFLAVASTKAVLTACGLKYVKKISSGEIVCLRPEQPNFAGQPRRALQRTEFVCKTNHSPAL